MSVVIDGTNGITIPEPLVVQSGSLSSPAVNGQIEYDGNVFYQTPLGAQRGLIPGAQFFRLNSAVVGANVNTAQSVFGVSVTLSSNTVYAFELRYSLNKTAGTSSHTISASFGGTATLNNIYLNTISGRSAANPPTGGASEIGTSITTTTGTLTAALTASIQTFGMRQSGTVSVNAGGTFTPQYTLSAAPGGAYSTLSGSYFLIYPIGASGANISVGTWA